jgi:hypothetical protein
MSKTSAVQGVKGTLAIGGTGGWWPTQNHFKSDRRSGGSAGLKGNAEGATRLLIVAIFSPAAARVAGRRPARSDPD